jgi:hypothetical protein
MKPSDLRAASLAGTTRCTTSTRKFGPPRNPARYDDRAFSGASLERPTLQQLLTDVRSGKIDIVLSHFALTKSPLRTRAFAHVPVSQQSKRELFARQIF